MNSDLFNLSDEMLQLVDNAAKSIENKLDVECSYSCICCGSGGCLIGVAND